MKAVALNARIVHVNGLRKDPADHTKKKEEDSRCLHQFIVSHCRRCITCIAALKKLKSYVAPSWQGVRKLVAGLFGTSSFCDDVFFLEDAQEDS